MFPWDSSSRNCSHRGQLISGSFFKVHPQQPSMWKSVQKCHKYSTVINVVISDV